MRKPGQIVLFQFPQTDIVQGKLRPALLLGKLPGPYDDWLMCMISSQMHQYIEGFDEIMCAFACGEGLVAGLTTELADGAGPVNPAIADQGVDVGIGDAEIVTTRLGAGGTVGINRLLASAGAFALGPGHD